MSKKSDNWLEDLVGVGILTAAAIALLHALGKKEKRYNCPVCNESIKEKENPCHNCKSELNWPNNQQENVRS